MMNTIRKIKAITFDTGGTILDWHTGFLNAFKKVGEKYEYNKNWASLTTVSYTHLRAHET